MRLKTARYPWMDRPLKTWVHTGINVDPALYTEYRSTVDRSFLFDPSSDLAGELKDILKENSHLLLAEADEILEGRFRLFGGSPVSLGIPPQWNSFPRLGGVIEKAVADSDRHWSAYSMDNFPHDIKLLWELSRFGWVFPLARAFFISHDRRYVEGFWSLLDSWRDVNLPNTGPQWISAQEVALRLMALVFGFYAFFAAFEGRPDRRITLAEMIAIHANRIPPTLNYARAQGNNHLLTEAVALYTVGVLFPEFRNAKRWQRLGRRWITMAVARQVFSDGGYVQHSANYQRLALHAALWAVRLAELNGEPFPGHTIESLQRMTDCLEALVDPETGKAPNFGPNDGALILPITSCAFHDYRPTIQLANQILRSKRSYSSGLWHEAGLWFGFSYAQSRDLQSGEIRKRSSYAKGVQGADQERVESFDFPEGSIHDPLKMDFPQAGLYLLRGEQTRGMLRCAEFRTRPAHSDQLHFDLWWRGCNIARDAGTYLYNGASPWDNGLSSARVHNTLLMDEQEPMWDAGRFLWLNWAQGKLLGRWRSLNGIVEALAAEHDGYRAWGVTARRMVVRAGEGVWLVVDELIGDGTHTLRNGWLLPDGGGKQTESGFVVDTPEGEIHLAIHPTEAKHVLYRAGKLIAGENINESGDTFGWYSPTYAYKEPALFLVTRIRGQLPLRLVSRWSLGQADPAKLNVTWNPPGSSPISIGQVTYGGEGISL